jgi:ATP-dependent helicase HrpB
MTFETLHDKLKDLPVATVAQDLVDSVQAGKVTVLTSDTGSGKTLYANTLLADQTDGQVVVLVPRRFLATNAAETVAELAGLRLGQEVGFAVGRQSGDGSRFSRDTELLFATYGYAIRSGLLMRATTVVLDEVHEAGIDTSLARAILHRRMATDSTLRVVEMSATIDATKQAEYWQDRGETAVHQADGRTFPCENRFVKPNEKSLAQTAIDLIQNDGRKGIAVFKPSKQECEDEANAIRALARQNDIEIEVSTIYGEMNSQERRAATRAPKEGVPKVIIGTNVIESGVNIPWLDAGISDGTGKISHYNERTGAKALKLEDLPQWRLTQQRGRLRFGGIYVLHSDTPFNDRPERTIPEIERAPLTELVMHCAALNLNPEELKFDSDIDRQKLINAREKLERLGLITNAYELTEAGQYVSNLPVGPETGAMLWEAKKQGNLADAIELAAVMEAGGLRADFRLKHGLDTTSDVLDSLKAFRQFRDNTQNREIQERLNISWKRFNEAKELVSDLRRRHDKTELNSNTKASDNDLKTLMLVGGINRLMQYAGAYQDMIGNRGAYAMGRFSIVGGGTPLVLADLREIHSRGSSFTVLESVTAVPPELLVNFAAERKDVFSEPSFSRNRTGDTVAFRYFGGAEVQFDASSMPQVLPTLIEPAYTAFKHTENSKAIAVALGIEPTLADNAATQQGDLEAVVQGLATEHAFAPMNVPATLTLGDKATPNKGDVRLGVQTVRSGPETHLINLDVPEQSLDATQLKSLMQGFPNLVTFGYNEARDKPFAFEIRDGKLVLHSSADINKWQDKEGRSLTDVAAAVLKEGQTLEISPVVAVRTDNVRSRTFDSVLSSYSSEYGPDDKQLATEVSDAFSEAVRGFAITANATGTVEMGGRYDESTVLVREEQKSNIQALEEGAQQVKQKILDAVASRKQQVSDTKQALSNAGFEDVSLDGYSRYHHAQFEQISGGTFAGKIDALLNLREQLERSAAPNTTFKVENTDFSDAGQVTITVVYEGTDSLPDKDALMNRLQEINPAINASHRSADTHSNQQTFRFTVSASETAPETSQNLADKLAAHQERLAFIPAERDVYWQQIAEAARVAEEARLNALRDQLPLLQTLAEKGGSLPTDFGQYVINDDSYWKTTEANSGDPEVDGLLLKLCANGRSDLSASDMLADLQAKERLALQQRQEELESLKTDLQWLADNEIGVPSDFQQFIKYQGDNQYIGTHEDADINALLLSMQQEYGQDHRRFSRIVSDLEEEIALQEKAGYTTTPSTAAEAIMASLAATWESKQEDPPLDAEREVAWQEYTAIRDGLKKELKTLETLDATVLPSEFAPYVTVQEDGSASFTAWGRNRNGSQNDLYENLRQGGVSHLNASDLVSAVTQQRSAEKIQQAEETQRQQTAEAERVAAMDQKWTKFQQTVQGMAPVLEALRALGADTLPQEFAPYVMTDDGGDTYFTAWGAKRNSKQDEAYADLMLGGVSDMSAEKLLVHVTQQRAAEMLAQTDAILDVLEGNTPLSADLERYTQLNPDLLQGEAAGLLELLQEHQEKTAVGEQEVSIGRSKQQPNFLVLKSVGMVPAGASR